MASEVRPAQPAAAAPAPDAPAPDAGLPDERLVREILGGVSWLGIRLRRQRQDHTVSWRGLGLLFQLNRRGTMTASALAEAHGVQPQSLTRLLATLENDGLIRRRPDPRDARQQLLDLTPAGLDVLRRDSARRSRWLAESMAAELTPTEWELLRLAARLMNRLGDR